MTFLCRDTKINIFTKSTLVIDELDWLPTIIIIIPTCKSAELCIFCPYLPEIMRIMMFLINPTLPVGEGWIPPPLEFCSAEPPTVIQGAPNFSTIPIS